MHDYLRRAKRAQTLFLEIPKKGDRRYAAFYFSREELKGAENIELTWSFDAGKTERAVWVAFDLNNGHPDARMYCWVFQTRDAAREHVLNQNANPRFAKLSSVQKMFKNMV